jgi:hypothetical protein
MLSALMAHTAWHWMLDRGSDLAKFPVPTLDAAFLASAMRGLMAMLVLAGLVWLVSGVLKRWLRVEEMTSARDVAGKTLPRGGEWPSL